MPQLIAGCANSTPPNSSHASSSVHNTLMPCAPRNASAGRPPSVVASATTRVSSPMHTNAKANHQVRISVSTPLVPVTTSAGSANENSAEAATKPSTNFGKRCQITAALARSPLAAPSLNVHQIASMNAATPIKAFCENLTITPVFIAASLINAPAATTDALVSSVPPSHAPATRSSMPAVLATHGMTIIIGNATISTSDVT